MNAEDGLQTLPGIAQHRIVVLLIDDQKIIGEAVRRLLRDEPDIDFHFCSEPTSAIAEAERVRPTLILQDLVMPEVSGLDLVRAFRERPATRRIPLIVLSSTEDPKMKAEAFALGANDYLVKLPDRIELIARMRYHSGAYIAHLERDEAYRALTAELAEAAEYVRSQLPRPLTGPIRSAWEFIPCTALGGDAFGHFDIDAEHFAMFLLDVCGHGVGTALLSLSAMNALAGQTLPDVDHRDPAAVLAAINALFPMEKHNNLYFTLWYGVLHRPTHRLRYSVAGHPPAVLVTPAEEISELWVQGMPIGVAADFAFASAEATVPPGARLYLFSDGVYEVTLPNGEAYTLDEFVGHLVAPAAGPGEKPRETVAIMRALQGRGDFDDDVSMLELQFD
jgi:sigma-B regulation protein RsbU (phosphoserine phosphatase)